MATGRVGRGNVDFQSVEVRIRDTQSVILFASVALDRADKAGVQLAECLRSRAHGQRPVSLVGFSCGWETVLLGMTIFLLMWALFICLFVGARCILRCILELAQHDDSNGILYNVVLIG